MKTGTAGQRTNVCLKLSAQYSGFLKKGLCSLTWMTPYKRKWNVCLQQTTRLREGSTQGLEPCSVITEAFLSKEELKRSSGGAIRTHQSRFLFLKYWILCQLTKVLQIFTRGWTGESAWKILSLNGEMQSFGASCIDLLIILFTGISDQHVLSYISIKKQAQSHLPCACFLCFISVIWAAFIILL